MAVIQDDSALLVLASHAKVHLEPLLRHRRRDGGRLSMASGVLAAALTLDGGLRFGFGCFGSQERRSHVSE